MFGEMIGFRTFFGNFKMGKSLIKAIEGMDVDAVENALAQQPSLAQFQSWITGTPLQAAAKHGSLDIVHALIQAGKCDGLQRTRRRRGRPSDGIISDQDQRRLSEFVNVQCTHSGKTALMFACEEGHSDVLQYLLSNGADALLTDRLKQSTALHYCIQNKHTRCAEVLLRYLEATLPAEQLKEYVNRKNNEGYSALSLAARSDCDLTELIVRYQPDLYVRTEIQDTSTGTRLSAQSTVFHLAAASGDLGTVSCLLREYFRHYHEVQFLEDAPDLRMFSNVGQELPYQVARRAGYREVARLLKPWVALESLQKKVSRVSSLRHLARVLLRSKLIGELDQIETEEKDGCDKKSLPSVDQQGEIEIELCNSTPRKSPPEDCHNHSMDDNHHFPTEISLKQTSQIFDSDALSACAQAMNEQPTNSQQPPPVSLQLSIANNNEKISVNLNIGENDENYNYFNGIKTQHACIQLQQQHVDKYDEKVGKNDDEEEEEEEECVICMESMVSVSIAGCGHRYCIPCTRGLLNKEVKGQKLIPCPICRRPIGGFKSLK
eukprot:TRINITY_DN5626_c0_g1_i1.p1 TRINITY_DN5626_c0_g1~~TRINITY_DN5626_c0_g1_i1.p1  ORF type:complete len:548 (-),score=80.95 TRINITY_DN5626_c0_g1_i1:324-1967(-)